MNLSESTTNDDSRVRDHLANERTYLAWTRTSIATMGFGVVIAKLRWLFPAAALQPPVRGIVHASNIGLFFTGFGIVTVILSILHFLTVRRQIRQGRYEASALLLVLYAALIAGLGLFIIWYLLESARPV